MPHWNGPSWPCPPIGFDSWWDVPEGHEALAEVIDFQRKLRGFVLSQRRVRPWWKLMFGGGKYTIPLFTAVALGVMKEDGLLRSGTEVWDPDLTDPVPEAPMG